jgi:beta-galactosidase
MPTTSVGSRARRHALIGTLSLTLLAAPLAQVPAPFFPMAVWYSGGKARAPMLSPIGPESEAEWRADLTTIRRLGFNTVRTWVEWSAGEPREGEYRLDNLALMLRLAEQQGLRVIVQVYVDSAPEWVGRKYPDGQFVAQSGAVIRSQAAPGYCVDHPGVRQAVHGRRTGRRTGGVRGATACADSCRSFRPRSGLRRR